MCFACFARANPVLAGVGAVGAVSLLDIYVVGLLSLFIAAMSYADHNRDTDWLQGLRAQLPEE